MARFSRACLALAIAGSLTSFVPRVASAQHISVDGRFSPAQTLVGPNYSIGANLGKQVRSNLFHSFGPFGLATGESPPLAARRRAAAACRRTPKPPSPRAVPPFMRPRD